jgi:hypothetical protein
MVRVRDLLSRSKRGVGAAPAPQRAEAADVVRALRRTCELLASSKDSDWTPWTATEIRNELTRMIDALEHGREIDRGQLRLLFVVTGPVQETAMASGWSEEMLTIAEIVDRYLGDA